MQEIDHVLYFPALFLGAAGAWIIANSGPKLELLDKPNERSSHDRPTPKGGGVGILAAFILASLFLKIPLTFWLAATLLAVFSFFGDRFEISPKFRLSVQFTAALVLVSPIVFFHSSPTLSPGVPPILCILPLSVFIVGTANFYNFMDGINGIAGITGLVAFALLAFSASLLEIDFSFVTLAICVSLSCLGFLPFNMPRAKVFMGDVGSILLGFVFAGMVIWLSKSFLDFICLVAFLFPFYADELTTMAIRIREGENLLQPHRRHFYQLLANEKGIAHWKVSVGYGLMQLAVGLTALFLKPFGTLMVLPVLAAYLSAFVLVSSLLRRNVAA